MLNGCSLIFRFNKRLGVCLTLITNQHRVTHRMISCSTGFGADSDQSTITIHRLIRRDSLGDNPAGGILTNMNHFGSGIRLHLMVG